MEVFGEDRPTMARTMELRGKQAGFGGPKATITFELVDYLYLLSLLNTYAGLLISTYSMKTKNRTNKNEKKILRRTEYLFRVTSFLKVAFIFGLLDSWTMHGQDNFDFAKSQI